MTRYRWVYVTEDGTHVFAGGASVTVVDAAAGSTAMAVEDVRSGGATCDRHSRPS